MINALISNKLFVINSILLFVFNVILSVLITKTINAHSIYKVKKLVDMGIEKISEQYEDSKFLYQLKKMTRTVVFKISLIEKLDIKYIHKSNIKKYIPFANIYLLCMFSIATTTLAYSFLAKVFNSFVSAFIISAIIGVIPFILLELLGLRNNEIIRRKLADFIAVLNRWCTVKEDIIYAFEKSIDCGLGEPLESYIKDFVIQTKRGLDVDVAFDILQLKVDMPLFDTFCINMKQVLKNRGDLKKILSKLEEEFYKLEEEYNRRKISTFRDRIYIYCSMFAVLIVGYSFLSSNPDVRNFYFNTDNGRFLMTIFCIMYALGFWYTVKINTFNY